MYMNVYSLTGSGWMVTSQEAYKEAVGRKWLRDVQCESLSDFDKPTSAIAKIE